MNAQKPCGSNNWIHGHEMTFGKNQIVVKTTLSQMSFHDRGFNSRDRFDSQSSRVPFFLMTEATMTARSNMRARGRWMQPPGVTQRIRSGRALPGGPSELTPTVTEVIFVRAWFLPSCYECTETMRIEQLDPVVRSAWFLCTHSTMVKTALSQRHTQTHTCTHMQNTYAHTVAFIHTYTYEHTHTHKRKCVRAHTYTRITFVCMCVSHMHTHATHVLTHSCLHTHIHT
jgi:hypothetical protein